MKKSIKEISWDVDELTYRADEALSYSQIKSYAKDGFKAVAFINEPTTPSESMKFGSLLDCIMTDKDNFNNKYIVADIPSITDMEKVVLTELVQMLQTEFQEIPALENVSDTMIVDACINTQSYKNAGPEKKVEKIRTDCTEYFNLVYRTTDKQIVSQENYQKALRCEEAIRNSMSTVSVFGMYEGSTFETQYQLKFKANYLGIPIRCMCDVVQVDHSLRTVRIIDLKTTSYPEYEFYRAFLQYRYDIQAEEYWWNVRQNMDNDEYFKDFTLLDFQFCVVNPDNPNPLLWEWSFKETDPEGKYGSNKMINLTKWQELTKELWKYKSTLVKVPDEIDLDKPNSIVKALNNHYM